MAEIAKALGDPIRLQLVDVLRKHAGKVCVCELVPLFDIAPADALPSPQEAARRRHRRLRAPRPVGLLLRQARGAPAARRVARRVTIRPAAPADAEAVCAIYNAGIAGRQATFETTPRTTEDVLAWYDAGLPFLVAVDAGGQRRRLGARERLQRPLRLRGRRRARRLRRPRRARPGRRPATARRARRAPPRRPVSTSSRAASSRPTRRASPSTAPRASTRSASSRATAGSTASGRTACSSSACSAPHAAETRRRWESTMPEHLQDNGHPRARARALRRGGARGSARPGESGCGCGPRPAAAVAVRTRRRARAVFGSALYDDAEAGRPRGGARRLARMRRPDGRRRPPRGRDRARPRLGSRRGRAHQRAPRRPDGQGDRPRHDGRDARARPRQRRARQASRTSSSSRATSRRCRCRTRPSTS